MAFGAAKTPSMADVLRKASAHLGDRKIVNSEPAAPPRRFGPRPKPEREEQPAEAAEPPKDEVDQ